MIWYTSHFLRENKVAFYRALGKAYGSSECPDGNFYDEATVDEILEDFLPKVCIVLDFDMFKMQADFEQALVNELYHLKSCRKPPFKNEVKQVEFFYIKFSETFYAANEIGLFQL